MEIVHRVYETGRLPEPGGSPRFATNGGTDGGREVFHVSFDTGIESPSVVVLDAVSLINDKPVQELDPLTERVDPDALDSLIAGAHDRQSDSVEVRFDYEGLRITITDDGDLWLRRK